jgi:hypothetical protein
VDILPIAAPSNAGSVMDIDQSLYDDFMPYAQNLLELDSSFLVCDLPKPIIAFG